MDFMVLKDEAMDLILENFHLVHSHGCNRFDVWTVRLGKAVSPGPRVENRLVPVYTVYTECIVRIVAISE